MRAQQVGMTVTHRVRLRYLKGLTGSNRILHRGTFYEIVGLQDMDVRTTHELICQVLMEQPVQK
jgi:SPP1 family predicted phage head-tail adaptor